MTFVTFCPFFFFFGKYSFLLQDCLLQCHLMTWSSFFALCDLFDSQLKNKHTYFGRPRLLACSFVNTVTECILMDKMSNLLRLFRDISAFWNVKQDTSNPLDRLYPESSHKMTFEANFRVPPKEEQLRTVKGEPKEFLQDQWTFSALVRVFSTFLVCTEILHKVNVWDPPKENEHLQFSREAQPGWCGTFSPRRY